MFICRVAGFYLGSHCVLALRLIAFVTSLCEDPARQEYCRCWLGYEMEAHNMACDHATRKLCGQHQDRLCAIDERGPAEISPCSGAGGWLREPALQK